MRTANVGQGAEGPQILLLPMSSPRVGVAVLLFIALAMALLLRSLRCTTRGSAATWRAVARRYASSSIGQGSSTFNALVVGGGLLGGAVGLWVS